jgi:uncharacterized caspase-like protein
MARRIALVVGVGRYEALPGLRSMDSDLGSLAAVLREPDSGAYEVTTVSNPSSQQLAATFNRTLTSAVPSDQLLLYFGGHGLVSKSGQFFLAGTDTDPDRIETSSYRADNLARLLSESRATRIVLLLDCCYSGSLVKSSAIHAGVRRVVPAPGNPQDQRAILTSASDIELSHYDTHGSVFTTAAVEGLGGAADLNFDGSIGVLELYQFVASRVAQAVPSQQPDYTVLGFADSFVVAESPRTALAELTLPPALVGAAGGMRPARELLSAYSRARRDLPADTAAVTLLERAEQVVSAATAIWEESVAATWLGSANSHLGGARPVDVLMLDGPDQVLAALESSAAGSFA